jgi:hypothetical protein
MVYACSPTSVAPGDGLAKVIPTAVVVAVVVLLVDCVLDVVECVVDVVEEEEVDVVD